MNVRVKKCYKFRAEFGRKGGDAVKMRVITGKYRGRVLKGPKHQGLRPTADRVKEALFNIIGPRINAAAFLDLFAGAGGIGIEALSRGANSVVFVDANPVSVKLLQSNLHFIEPEDNLRVIHAEAAKALNILSREQSRFDLIFLDPPFAAGLLEPSIQTIFAENLLKNTGLLIAEHARKFAFAVDFPGVLETRHYGEVSLTLFSIC
jgi:16S rRNA (guanine966-N2)-methyltransferase